MKSHGLQVWFLAMIISVLLIIISFQNANLYDSIEKLGYRIEARNVFHVMNSHMFNQGDRQGDCRSTFWIFERLHCDKATVTLFTTVKYSASKNYIYKNTIQNWALLKPDVIPVLFIHLNASAEFFVDFARQRNWHVFQVPKTGVSGLPVLRHMFMEVQRLFDTPFYGYANGDILFDGNLTNTIRELIKLKKRSSNLLVIGQRTNWHVKWQQNISSLQEIGNYATSGKLYTPDAQDYFLSTYEGFPWSNIPDFVVGRIAYDNWIVVTALMKQIPLVDATNTITALHQTDARGDREGAMAVAKRVNRLLAGEKFSYRLGSTLCAQFRTNYKNGSIIVTKNMHYGNKCNNKLVPPVQTPFRS